MAIRVRVGKDHRITIPDEVRKRLAIKSGDDVLIELRDGCFVLRPDSGNYAERLRGLHREIWEDVEPQEYVRREREGWEC